MQIERVTKGRTMTVVTVSNVPSVDDQAVKAFAIVGAGEAEHRLFGHNVTYFDEDGSLTAVVDLYTD